MIEDLYIRDLLTKTSLQLMILVESGSLINPFCLLLIQIIKKKGQKIFDTFLVVKFLAVDIELRRKIDINKTDTFYETKTV